MTACLRTDIIYLYILKNMGHKVLFYIQRKFTRLTNGEPTSIAQ